MTRLATDNLSIVENIADLPANSVPTLAQVLALGAAANSVPITGLAAMTGADDFTILKTHATPTATERLIRSELTISGAVSGMGTNSLAGVRGVLLLAASANVSSGYLYGVQGKIDASASSTVINVGSDHVAGVYAQLAVGGVTVTSGHVAAVIADIQTPPATGAALIDLIYAEQVTGTFINSLLKMIGDVNYIFDLSWQTAGSNPSMSTTGTAGATATKGWLKVLVNGVPRYIPLTDSVT